MSIRQLTSSELPLRSRAVLLPLALGLVLVPALTASPTSDTPIADAALVGDHDTVRSLLRHGGDVNAAQGDGMTALHWAAMQGDAELVDMLLYAGANVQATTRLGGYTPLLLASRSGNAAVVQKLLAAGADPLQVTGSGTTTLMFAAASGSAEAVEQLIASGAPVDQTEAASGQTALMFAAANNRASVVDALIRHGADPAVTTAVIDAEELEKANRAAQRKKFEALRAAREEEEAAKKEAEKKQAQEAKAKAAAAEQAEAIDDPELGGQVPPADLEQPRSEQPASASAAKAETKVAGKAPLDPTAELKGAGQDDAEGQRAERKAPKKQRKKAKKKKGVEEERPRPKSFGQLVGKQGGMTALHHAARQGHLEAVKALLAANSDINQVTEGDQTSPLLIATINGHFDLARYLLEQGADPTLASAAGATPLYGAINIQWAPHSFYPQPSPAQQKTTHLEMLQALLDHGADPNARLEKKLWYTGFNFDQSGVDEAGATAFWRAAQAGDVEAMRLLVAGGADPTIPTIIVPERRLPNGRNAGSNLEAKQPKLGGPAVTPFQMASGAGYVGNYHRNAPGGWMPAVRYFVEEIGVDVNAADHKGYTPLHSAAAMGDNELILYLVFHGANVKAVNHDGQTVADMANGPVQRIQPFPETLKLLEGMGSENNDNCVSC